MARLMCRTATSLCSHARLVGTPLPSRYHCGALPGASMNPSLYVIAGPTGAGKTTFAREFLPNYADCKHSINADIIAEGGSPLSPNTVAFRAGRHLLQEMVRSARRGTSF